MTKLTRFWTAAAAVVLLCGGSWMLVREEIMHNKKMAEVRVYSPAAILAEPEETVVTAVTTTLKNTTAQSETKTTASETTETTTEPEPSALEPRLSQRKRQELTEQAAALSAANPNAIGWLYVPDTPIDYPIMQAGDNDFYLDHTSDNTYLRSGSIFLDCRYEPHFLNQTNIVYGHNMANGTMFGDIRNFKAWSYYENHPYGWLVNSDEVYLIDFFSLAIVDAYDSLYDGSVPLEDWVNHLYDVSMYYDGMEIAETNRLISLSTCASDFPDARAVLTGKLVAMNGGEDDA